VEKRILLIIGEEKKEKREKLISLGSSEGGGQFTGGRHGSGPV